MTEEGTERTTLEQLNEKLEQMLEYIKAIEKSRKFQTVLEHRLFLFSFLIGIMGSLLTFCFTEFLKGEGSQRIFWLFPLTIGSIMTIIGIIPYYLNRKEKTKLLKLPKLPKPMEFMGNKARDAIENFMKAFPDYEIEHVVADLQVKPTKIQGSLEIKIKKHKKTLKNKSNKPL